MKILKIILLIIGLLIVVVLITPLFVKKEYSLERQVMINRSSHDVFSYVRYLKNQDNYSKWAKLDPEMEKTYRGTDGTVGFVSAWASQQDNVGSGEQEIIGITDGERIDYELRFFEPWESTSRAWMVTESITDSSSTVIWGFNGKMTYPMNIMLLFYDIEKLIGEDYDIGLSNLKGILERRES